MTERRLNRIAWMEGMFLRPHHLQHHDLSVQDRLDYHLHNIDPFHWGVRDLEINEEALSDHRIEILRLEAVLPGGIIIRYPGNAVVETREFRPDVQRLDVWVGVRRLSPTDANSAPIDDSAKDVRYKVSPVSLPDLQRGGANAQVEILLPNVRVFVSGEEEELETHEVIRLARVEATGEIKDPFALSRTYAPPLLAVQAFPPLDEEIRKIAAQISAKVAVVAERTQTIAVSEIPRMMMRYTLARITPVLTHLLGTGETRPYQLYTTLVEAAGALASFVLKEPAELPPYDHEDLYACFHALLTFIDTHLEEVLPVRFTELKMGYDARKKMYVTRELSVALVDPRNRYVLAVRADMDAEELKQWVAEKGKAGSAEGVPTQVMMSLPGLRLEHMPGQPADIAIPPGAECFKVEPHGNHWTRVKDEFSFALSMGALTDADVRLYVLTGEE